MDYEQLQFERNKAIEDMIKELKNGVIGWHDRTSYFVPSNPTSKIFFTGVNRFLLYGICKEKGYKVPYFCTKKQAEENGWMIKDGQEPETLVMIKEYENKKIKKLIDGVERTVLEKVKLPEREIKEFLVYNIDQFDNASVKEHTFPDTFLDKMGELLEVKDIDAADFTDKKEYAHACIRAAVAKVYKNNASSLKADLTESFICNSLGLDMDPAKEYPVSEWVTEVENNKLEFLKTLSAAENSSKKIVDIYKNNLERAKKEKDLEEVNVQELYENVARDLQKLYVFDNKFFVYEDIMKSLKSEDTRRMLMASLMKKYSKNKYRTHVRDLILIGKVVSSLSRTDTVENQRYVDTIKKEINVIEKSVTVDFGKDFENHPYNLAVAISNAAAGVLKMPKEEIFDKLKDKDGRTEIMDSLGKIYIEKLQATSKRSAPAKELNVIKMVINEIATLENPDLVKNKSSEKFKEGYSVVPAGKKNSSYRDFADELRDDGKKQSTVTKNNKRRR